MHLQSFAGAKKEPIDVMHGARSIAVLMYPFRLNMYVVSSRLSEMLSSLDRVAFHKPFQAAVNLW